MFPEESDFDDDLVFHCAFCGEPFKLLGAKFRHMINCNPQAVDNAVD